MINRSGRLGKASLRERLCFAQAQTLASNKKGEAHEDKDLNRDTEQSGGKNGSLHKVIRLLENVRRPKV